METVNGKSTIQEKFQAWEDAQGIVDPVEKEITLKKLFRIIFKTEYLTLLKNNQKIPKSLYQYATNDSRFDNYGGFEGFKKKSLDPWNKALLITDEADRKKKLENIAIHVRRRDILEFFGGTYDEYIPQSLRDYIAKVEREGKSDTSGGSSGSDVVTVDTKKSKKSSELEETLVVALKGHGFKQVTDKKDLTSRSFFIDDYVHTITVLIDDQSRIVFYLDRGKAYHETKGKDNHWHGTDKVYTANVALVDGLAKLIPGSVKAPLKKDTWLEQLNNEGFDALEENQELLSTFVEGVQKFYLPSVIPGIKEIFEELESTNSAKQITSKKKDFFNKVKKEYVQTGLQTGMLEDHISEPMWPSINEDAKHLEDRLVQYYMLSALLHTQNLLHTITETVKADGLDDDFKDTIYNMLLRYAYSGIDLKDIADVADDAAPEPVKEDKVDPENYLKDVKTWETHLKSLGHGALEKAIVDAKSNPERDIPLANMLETGIHKFYFPEVYKGIQLIFMHIVEEGLIPEKNIEKLKQMYLDAVSKNTLEKKISKPTLKDEENPSEVDMLRYYTQLALYETQQYIDGPNGLIGTISKRGFERAFLELIHTVLLKLIKEIKIITLKGT